MDKIGYQLINIQSSTDHHKLRVIFICIKMTQLGWVLAASCVCYVQSTMVKVDNIEMERFTAADSRPARLATVYKSSKDNLASPTRQSNVVYGKAKGPRPNAYAAPGVKSKNPQKLKPSQEDAGHETESLTQYAQGYKPSPQETAAMQKYMQKYASQVFASQKHAAQLSDAQKHVVANDPYRYVAPSKNYKFIPINSPQTKPSEKVKEFDAIEVGTEKYQSVQVHQHVVVQPSKQHKSSPPKKAYSFDNAQQSSDYKYSSQDSHSPIPSQEKDTWSSYEPYQTYGQYGVMTPEKSSEFAKITGYKFPASSSISIGGHSVDTKEEEGKSQEEVEEEQHYPHHEPKYEYMYQVHDPEKHNNFGHSEARKGKNTWGRYYVQLPDGRLETVKYWVDKHGYHAEVDFKGQAQHPSHKEYAHQEESSSGYPKVEEISIGGHSEGGLSAGDVEEY